MRIRNRDFDALGLLQAPEGSAGDFLRLRPNTLVDAYDLGARWSLAEQWESTLGDENGGANVFQRFELLGPANLRVMRLPVIARTDVQISLGLKDASRRPVAPSETFRPEGGGAGWLFAALPAGVYVLTVSSSQWRAIITRWRLETVRTLQAASA